MGADAERTEDAPAVDEPAAAGLHYPDLTIRGFRAIKDLHVPRLGRVTLITGKNNTGKTSILEALYLHATRAAPRVAHDILLSREEARAETDDDGRSFDRSQVPALFHGFRSISDDLGQISISTSGGGRPMEVALKVEWSLEEGDWDGPGPSGLTLIAESDGERRVYQLDPFSRGGYKRYGDVPWMPCVPVNFPVNHSPRRLAMLWESALREGGNRDLVEALRIIDPGISAMSMNNRGPSSVAFTAIVRSESFEQPVPLRTFGDGMHRLFVIVLSLLNAKGGILLVDEFENGLHHTAQLDAWRMIFRLARDLDVQVFATTHSWDAVATFADAAKESPEDGALLRLIRRGDDIIPTVFTEHDLAIAAYERIEVR